MNTGLGGAGADDALDTDETVRAWMVERTFSADSPNIHVTVYATTDGRRYLQKERAYNRFSNRIGPVVTAAIDVDPGKLSAIDDPDTVDRYAAEAERMAARHDPDDAV